MLHPQAELNFPTRLLWRLKNIVCKVPSPRSGSVPPLEVYMCVHMHVCACTYVDIHVHMLDCTAWSRERGSYSRLLLPSGVLTSVCEVHNYPREVELGSQSPAIRPGSRGPEGFPLPQTPCHMGAVAWKGGLVRAGDRLPNPLSAHPTIRHIRD